MPRVARKRTAKQAGRGDGQAEPASREGLPRAIWSGTLSFGLVTIPVELYSATRNARGSLRMLAPDGTPLTRRFFSADGKPLEGEELERGYAIDPEHYVIVTDDELERLLPDQSRDIALTRFVPQDSIPPLYFERAYILAPAREGSSAYQLLTTTMEKLRKVGIATFVMRDRQYVVAISARDGLLHAETLRFSDELRTPEDVGLAPQSAPSEADLRRMRDAVKKLSKPSAAEGELKDSYWQRLEKLVAQKKAEHKDVVPAPTEGGAPEGMAEVVDLMELLKKSLAEQASPAKESTSKRPTVKKARTHPTTHRKRAS